MQEAIQEAGIQFAARMRRIVRCAAFAVIGGAVCLGGISVAGAASTHVGSPYFNEASHARIMSHAYGGTFQHQSRDLSNGSINARRVNDNRDQLYDAGEYHVEAMARFSSNDHWFGYTPGESGGNFVNLFDATNFGFVEDDTSATVTIDEPFRWTRRGSGGTFTTQDSDNGDDADHVVTYEINGESTEDGSYMLFVEDRPYDISDHDFQDLVVRITRLNNRNNNNNGKNNPGHNNPGNNNHGNDGGGDNNHRPDDNNDDANHDDNDVNVVPTPGAAGAGLVLLLGSVLVRRQRSGRGRGE